MKEHTMKEVIDGWGYFQKESKGTRDGLKGVFYASLSIIHDVV